MNSGKKILAVVVLILILFLIGIMVYYSVKRIKEKKELSEELQEVPVFNFEISDNTFLSSLSTKLDNPLVIIYFNSECDYCGSEAVEIVTRKKQVRKLNFLFVSTEDIRTIKGFADSTGLSSLSNVIVGRIEDGTAEYLLGITTIPQIFIYNIEGKLTKEFKGMTKVETLLRYANQN